MSDQSFLADTVGVYLEQRGKTIAYALVIGILILVGAYRFFGGGASDVTGYLQAAAHIEKWKDAVSSGKNSSQAWDSLQGNLKNYPPLQKRYEGVMAQTLLASGDESLAALTVASLARRVPEEVFDPYKQYTQGSLDLTSWNPSTKKIPESLLKGGSNQGVLGLYILLRQIVVLKQSGEQTQAGEVWAQLKKELSNQEYTDLNGVFRDHFQEGAVDLDEWIEK